MNTIKSESIVLELRAAEGGADARLLVEEFLQTYCRVAERRGL